MAYRTALLRPIAASASRHHWTSAAATHLALLQQRRTMATCSRRDAVTGPTSRAQSRPLCRSFHRSHSHRLSHRHSRHYASTASASEPAPSSSSVLSRLSAVSFSDALLGFLCGVTLFYCADWLLYWPEPLPALQSLLDDDPLLQSAVGSPVRISPLWTGSVKADSFSVSLPVSGGRGSGRVYARGVVDGRTRQWKLVYLQASVGGLQQRHSLHIPPHMDVRGAAASGSVASAGALVMPANFDPTLLPPDQFVRYQHFLQQHNLQQWKPDTSAKQAEQSSDRADSISGSDATTGGDNTSSRAVHPAAESPLRAEL